MIQSDGGRTNIDLGIRIYHIAVLGPEMGKFRLKLL